MFSVVFAFISQGVHGMLMFAADSLYFPFSLQDSEQRTAVHICILKKMPEEFLASMDCWIVGLWEWELDHGFVWYGFVRAWDRRYVNFSAREAVCASELLSSALLVNFK